MLIFKDIIPTTICRQNGRIGGEVCTSNIFYKNSLAIIFPYIRAFISTLTLQSNAGLIILPTLNLTHLEKPFRENTKEVEE